MQSSFHYFNIIELHNLSKICTWTIHHVNCIWLQFLYTNQITSLIHLDYKTAIIQMLFTLQHLCISCTEHFQMSDYCRYRNCTEKQQSGLPYLCNLDHIDRCNPLQGQCRNHCSYRHGLYSRQCLFHIGHPGTHCYTCI